MVGLKKPTYKKDHDMIFAIYETDIEGFNFKIYQKSINKDLNIIKKQIEEEGKNLTSYKLNSSILQDTINKLQELQKQLKDEEYKLNSYTIQDYLNKVK